MMLTLDISVNIATLELVSEAIPPGTPPAAAGVNRKAKGQGLGGQRMPGRPRHGDSPVVDWDAVDKLLVFGEREVDPQTGHETIRFPSLVVLGKRYNVSRTVIWRYARKYRCYERRQEMRAMTLSRTDARVVEKMSIARALSTSDVVNVVDDYIVRFRKDLSEGKVRTDSAGDLDRLVRLKELLLGGADSRQELQGGITLEAIQQRHRQLRSQLDAMTPELAGTASATSTRDDVSSRPPQASRTAVAHHGQDELEGEERGDGAAD